MRLQNTLCRFHILVKMIIILNIQFILIPYTRRGRGVGDENKGHQGGGQCGVKHFPWSWQNVFKFFSGV